MIVLYDSSETSFTTMGLGSLPDAISCSVKEELNGSFELEMEYPITGLHYSDIQLRRIIFAKSNPYSDPQAFRIYSITKPLNGVVTINAEHISYDLSGYPISSLEATTAGEALSMIPGSIPLYGTNIFETFTFSTDINYSESSDETKVLSVVTPVSVRSLLGGDNNSILTIFGGEYEFDNFNVKLYSNRGHDRGVTILYGKNLTDIEQEENCNSVYTGIYPFTYNEEEGLTELDEKYVYVQGDFGFTRILPVDFTSYWNSAPLQGNLRLAAQQYIEDNNIGVPQVSLKVSFVDLSKSNEMNNAKLLESVYLGDIVTVKFEKLGIDAKAKCVSTEYDALLDRYTEVELGSPKTDIGDVILDQGKKATESLKEVLGGDIPTRSFVQEAAMNAAKLLNGGLGGYVVLHSSSGGNEPDELLIMDSPNINQARKIWRFNKNGLGFLSQGYNSPVAEIALTSEGYIKSDRILASEIMAQRYELQSSATLTNVIQAIPEGLSLTAVNEGDTYTTTETHYEEIDEDVGEAALVSQTTPDDTIVYGFDRDGQYWVSKNQGINRSISYMILEFNFAQETDVTIRCYSDGEAGWDYGLISKVDAYLSYTYDENTYRSQDVLFSFKEIPPSTSPETVNVTVPSGVHHITFKYLKDVSNNSGTDTMKFRCTAKVTHSITSIVTHTTPAYTKSISLMYKDEGETTGWNVASNVPLVFGGLVRFVDLATEGSTEINGGNILTENLRVNEVKYYEDGYWYPIASGRISGPSTMTYIGPRNVTNFSLHNLYLFGTYIYFTRIGMNSSDSPLYGNESLVIDPSSHIIRPNGAGQWDLGTSDRYFGSLYAQKIYLIHSGSGTQGTPYLEYKNGHLQWDGVSID